MYCCGQLIEKADNCRLCVVCGVVQSFLVASVGFTLGGATARVPYSRLKRFQRVFSNAFGLRVARLSPKLLQEFDRTPPLSTQDLFRQIKGFKHREMKRYDAIAFLSVQMLSHKIKPLTQGELVVANSRFRDVESTHSFCGGTFPAYSWVVERILTIINRGDLMQYVHRLKCPKRRRLYDTYYGYLLQKEVFRPVNARGYNRYADQTACMIPVVGPTLRVADIPPKTRVSARPGATQFDLSAEALLESIGGTRSGKAGRSIRSIPVD